MFRKRVMDDSCDSLFTADTIHLEKGRCEETGCC